MENSEEDTHHKYMDLACKLASRSILRGSGPFGAVIIHNNTGEIVGRGHNMVTTNNDPTLHAEIVAIRNSCHLLQTFSLEDCTLYTSCEPCPMCLSAAYWARISAIYYGNTKDDAKNIGFDDSFIYDEIQKPIENRTMKMVHMKECAESAKTAFDEWANKEDKIEY